MIQIGNNQELDQNKYDENWLIVRKPDPYPDFVKLESLLSPSPDLFRKDSDIQKDYRSHFGSLFV